MMKRCRSAAPVCGCRCIAVIRESIYVETETEVSLDAIRQAAEECPGLVLNEAPYPTPKECTDSDAVVIGRPASGWGM